MRQAFAPKPLELNLAYMINLAPFRYRRVLARHGGPIERIETSEVRLFGRKLHQANAFLSSALVNKTGCCDVYSEADGSGMAESPARARNLAISEALERWAYHVKSRDCDRDLYGFHKDASSNGMAAFPGVFQRQARKPALDEALERYCLVAWWNGILRSEIFPTRWPGVMALRIIHGFWKREMVVCFKECTPGGFFSYGHAVAEDSEKACARAVDELCRNEFVLRSYRASHPDITIEGLGIIRDIFERRCLFFSFPEGHRLFLQKAGKAVNSEARPPAVLFDGPLLGPWSKYATVWRVALEMPSLDFLSMRQDIFIW